LIQVQTSETTFKQLDITIKGQSAGVAHTEHITRQAIQRYMENISLTSQEVYSQLNEVEVTGLEPNDQVTIFTVDYTQEDQTLFLPLWAGVPEQRRACSLIDRNLLDMKHFYHPFGISACGSLPSPLAEATCLGVQMPWQQLIGEGLLVYGYVNEASQLVAHIMDAIILNLKEHHAFFVAYHARTGVGIGERNALAGLAPLGLFLKTLGVQFLPGSRVRLTGKNPFPWPVTVKYRGLCITRSSNQSKVTFPDGRTIAISDPSDILVCPE
jgi:hypothetical protein